MSGNGNLLSHVVKIILKSQSISILLVLLYGVRYLDTSVVELFANLISSAFPLLFDVLRLICNMSFLYGVIGVLIFCIAVICRVIELCKDDQSYFVYKIIKGSFSTAYIGFSWMWIVAGFLFLMKGLDYVPQIVLMICGKKPGLDFNLPVPSLVLLFEPLAIFAAKLSLLILVANIITTFAMNETEEKIVNVVIVNPIKVHRERRPTS